MANETDVTTRHKKKLAEIREKPDVSRNGKTVSRGYSEIAGSSIQGTQRADERDIDSPGNREEGIYSGQGTNGGSSQGIRQIKPEDVNTAQGISGSDHAPGTATLISDLTTEQKEEHERELARQRKQRQRDRERDTPTDEILQEDNPVSRSDRDRDRDKNVTHEDHATTYGDPVTSRFQFKNPLDFIGDKSEKVKLFSKKEATEEREHLAFLFYHGSALLDTFLEIVVKDHEAVAIWAMEEAEADMFAEMHLERATKDIGAARIARAALALYDKWFTLAYVTPRFIRTRSYVKEHRGFSFK